MQGDELKEIREALGLSQAQMAEQLGMSRVFIGMMERGDKAIERRTELAARAIGPLGPAFIVGGPSHGRAFWASKFQLEIVADNPRWLPPLVSAGTPGTMAPATTYRYSGVTLPETGERIFVPANEEGWDEARAHREGLAVVAAWQSRQWENQ